MMSALIVSQVADTMFNIASFSIYVMDIYSIEYDTHLCNRPVRNYVPTAKQEILYPFIQPPSNNLSYQEENPHSIAPLM